MGGIERDEEMVGEREIQEKKEGDTERWREGWRALEREGEREGRRQR